MRWEAIMRRWGKRRMEKERDKKKIREDCIKDNV